MKSDDGGNLNIFRQEAGRFNRRFKVGPACWPHFDLLWVHEGHLRLQIGEDRGILDLQAPMGVLLFPDTPFQGTAVGDFAAASVCHFSGPAFIGTELDSGFSLPDSQDTFHVQNLIHLSLSYVRRNVEMNVRRRLLRSILDCFGGAAPDDVGQGRLSQAWSQARERLERIRGLTDVAAGVGLSESAFRTMHRKALGSSAGKHLQELRLSEAERLLATTGDTVAQVSRAVGYAHPESLSSAFKKSRGRTPAEYRRWCKRFA